MSDPTKTYAKACLVAPDLLLKYCRPDDGLADIVQRAKTAVDLIEQLLAQERLTSLASALAFMLPKREAVWWGCLVTRHGARLSGLSLPRALLTAEQWTRDASEDTRYSCYEVAEAEGFETIQAWVAMAAFWAGPSIAPRDSEIVAPPDHLTSVAVNAALVLALSGHDGAKPVKVADAVAIGLEMANGGSGRMAWSKLQGDTT